MMVQIGGKFSAKTPVPLRIYPDHLLSKFGLTWRYIGNFLLSTVFYRYSLRIFHLYHLLHYPDLMSQTKLNLKTPDEAEIVYYEAFMHCDAKVMAALWADGDVVCIHPGSGAIVGYEAVVRSWNHIFANSLPPQITFTVIKSTVSDSLAVNLVTEELASDDGESVLVLATNVYQKFDQGWLMIEHHASLVQSRAQNQTLQ